MTLQSQCLLIFRIDNFVRSKLLASKYRIVQAFGAFGINFLMGFCYATVLQVGQAEYNKRKVKK